jgi:hypothetical protein
MTFALVTLELMPTLSEYASAIDASSVSTTKGRWRMTLLALGYPANTMM